MGLSQQAPPDQAKGGLGNFPATLGHATGMPHMMMGFIPTEFVVTPQTTYIQIGMYDYYRRTFTDGRDWPTQIEPTFAGYSISRWIVRMAMAAMRRLRLRRAVSRGARLR
jgi:hypothetical protein